MNARQRQKLCKHFDNPYYDKSDPALWDQELTVIQRLRGGETLVQSRLYHEYDDPRDDGTYCVCWYWEEPHEIQWDGPVEQLLSRGIIRSVRCGGGATHMILTGKAEEYFKRNPNP